MPQRLAVVIPVYNRAQTVRVTLDSVAQQTMTPSQVVVVDDGSTDGTAASAARNRGIESTSHCDLLAFLDSDDAWPHDFLARTSSALRNDSNAVAATVDRSHWHEEAHSVTVEDLSPIQDNATVWLFAKYGGITSCSLLRAHHVRLLGGFREDLLTGHDCDLYLRLSLLGRWLYCPGNPVILGRGLARRLSEESHLSDAFFDNQRRWALIFEHFITHCHGQDHVPANVYRRVLATRWYRAGRQLMRHGLANDAKACFQRSCHWKRWNKAWFRRFQASWGARTTQNSGGRDPCVHEQSKRA